MNGKQSKSEANRKNARIEAAAHRPAVVVVVITVPLRYYRISKLDIDTYDGIKIDSEKWRQVQC